MSAPTFIDLFSGCGGFTLGMLRAGFQCTAAIDSNAEAIATLRRNLQAQAPARLVPDECFGRLERLQAAVSPQLTRNVVTESNSAGLRV